MNALRYLTQQTVPVKGWRLRIRLCRGLWHIQFFSDLVNGGRQEALHEALKARDLIEASLKP